MYLQIRILQLYKEAFNRDAGENGMQCLFNGWQDKAGCMTGTAIDVTVMR